MGRTPSFVRVCFVHGHKCIIWIFFCLVWWLWSTNIYWSLASWDVGLDYGWWDLCNWENWHIRGDAFFGRQETNGKKDFEDQTYYKRLVGCLKYLTSIRPDIVYSIGIINKFMESPQHLIYKLQRILRYIHDGMF